MCLASFCFFFSHVVGVDLMREWRAEPGYGWVAGVYLLIVAGVLCVQARWLGGEIDGEERLDASPRRFVDGAYAALLALVASLLALLSMPQLQLVKTLAF